MEDMAVTKIAILNFESKPQPKGNRSNHRSAVTKIAILNFESKPQHRHL